MQLLVRELCLSGFFLVCMLINSCLAGATGWELFGAGATFPQPLYNKMFEVYTRQSGVKISYEGIGSGGGIEKIIAKKVDFAGSDAFMVEKELKAAGTPIIHVPTCLGAVVMTYNLPANPKLRFTPDVIADIFLGKVKKWNDPRMAEINPGIKLPNMAITTVHRSDGSGTTFIFSEYLSKVSKVWKEKVGVSKSLSWPVGVGANGNPGVAGSVRQIPGAIGYVELIYALGTDMTFAAIRNKAGAYVEPTPESVSLSAVVNLPDNTKISLTDTLAPRGYPISGFTWLILYQEQSYGGRSPEQAEELTKMLWWIIHEGQRYSTLLQYSPLPEEAVRKAEVLLKTLTYKQVQLLR
jgi:phosphate transport system substrate-binding protein